MIRFYEVETEHYYLIIMSDKKPEIGETYIGWVPDYISLTDEFDDLPSTKKIISWNRFKNIYDFGEFGKLGTITITHTEPPSSDYSGGCGEIIDWLNLYIHISDKELSELKKEIFTLHLDAYYTKDD